MKKAFIVLVIVAVVIAGGAFYIFNKEQMTPGISGGLVFDSLVSGQEVASPLRITGHTNGDKWNGWEGQVGTVDLLDKDGKSIGFAMLASVGEWMQEKVSFSAKIKFWATEDQTGTLLFRNENPSGLAENDRTIRVPVKIKAMGETQTVKLYFNYDGLGTAGSCGDVMPLERIIPKTQAVARAAIEELIDGPASQEKMLGWYSSINPGTKIQSLAIDDKGVARIDFDDQLEYQIGGSCLVSAIRASITQTLKQFPSVKSVIISINGRTEDILQP